MTASLAVACTVAATIALLRWLRVCQREHYAAGSCVRFAVRWIRVRPSNGIVVGVALLALAFSVYGHVSDRHSVTAGLGLVVACCAGVFPVSMPVLGAPRLRFTRRALRLLAVTVVMLAGAAGLLISVAGLALSMSLGCLLVPVTLDVAAAAMSPVEKRLLLPFRRSAQRRLAEVRPTVIAVTGSWGKTSTKGHIRDLLSDDTAVVASPASFNNAAGLSMTVNDHLLTGTEVLIAEMGMHKPGEIRDLCSWIQPDIAVITSIGPMHLERAGSMERIVAAKSEVLERATTAVLWVDDPRLDDVANSCDVDRLWRVGTKGGDRLDVEVHSSGDELVVGMPGAEVGRCRIAEGTHPGNVGCAVASVLAYGMEPARIRRRLRALHAPEHRSVVQRAPNGMVVIDDTFNANPSGARAALALLTRVVPTGRRAVITPGMIELGSQQHRANADWAARVVKSGATLVVVGRINRRALVTGASGEAVTVRNRREARNWIHSELSGNDGVLWENDLPDHYP